MTKPVVGQFMTVSPYSIGVDQSLSAAREMMDAHRIRHLPVLHGGHCVGVVTERDLNLIQTLRDVDPARVPVEEAMTPDPYTVSPQAALEQVVLTMRERRYGSAVVVEYGRVVGVFTVVDALAVLLQLLESAPEGTS